MNKYKMMDNYYLLTVIHLYLFIYVWYIFKNIFNEDGHAEILFISY